MIQTSIKEEKNKKGGNSKMEQDKFLCTALLLIMLYHYVKFEQNPFTNVMNRTRNLNKGKKLNKRTMMVQYRSPSTCKQDSRNGVHYKIL